MTTFKLKRRPTNILETREVPLPYYRQYDAGDSHKYVVHHRYTEIPGVPTSTLVRHTEIIETDNGFEIEVGSHAAELIVEDWESDSANAEKAFEDALRRLRTLVSSV